MTWRRLTTAEFIAKAQQVHGDRYDYSRVGYVDSATKVEIICPEHGVFLQRPTNHLSGQGCPVCRYIASAAALRSNTGDFITKARIVHGGRYDYSRVGYVDSATKVEIICPDHGPFRQTPNCHLKGQRCPKCFGNAKSSTAEFIAKAREVHGDHYDYSRVDYVDNATKVEIICPDHGPFRQTPNNHLRGAGCLKCGVNVRTDANRSDTAEFIAKAREVHGDRYDYSRVDYATNRTKVEIVCPDHGPFRQTPNSHLKGIGCPKCVGSISKAGSAWLDSLGIEGLIREHHIPGTHYHADGFDPATNTIYEFHGDHWHGHRAPGEADWRSSKTKKLASEMYAQTLAKETRLRELGYTVIAFWEHAWSVLGKPIPNGRAELRIIRSDPGTGHSEVVFCQKSV